MNKRIVAAVLGAAALALPAAAGAHGGGKGHEKKADKVAKHQSKGKHGAKKVTFVFKGTFTAPGTVNVLAGNSHVRKGGFVGQEVEFDFAGAKVVVADTNADGKRDVTDVKDGDLVLVQARMARKTKHVEPVVSEMPSETDESSDAIAARKLVDKTNKPSKDGGDESETPEAPEAPEAA